MSSLATLVLPLDVEINTNHAERGKGDSVLESPPQSDDRK